MCSLHVPLPMRGGSPARSCLLRERAGGRELAELEHEFEAIAADVS